MHLIILYSSLFSSVIVFSKITITTHTTQTHSEGAILIHDIDTNSDGDTDYISISRFGAREFQFEESIRSEQLTMSTEDLYSLLILDFDGDQDLDVDCKKASGNLNMRLYA